MRKIFQQDLEELGDDLLAMAQKVAEAVASAGEALREVDIEKAERVIDADNRIDEYEDSIEAAAISMLALQSPVATDLRLVVSAIRLSATLERMGDLARHVAFITRSRFPESASSGEMEALLHRMSVSATEMVQMLVRLMEEHSLELIDEISTKDDELDSALQESFALLAREDIELQRQEVVDAVLLARFLERLGDHVVSGALRIQYLVTGDLDKSVYAGEADKVGE